MEHTDKKNIQSALERLCEQRYNGIGGHEGESVGFQFQTNLDDILNLSIKLGSHKGNLRVKTLKKNEVKEIHIEPNLIYVPLCSERYKSFLEGDLYKPENMVQDSDSECFLGASGIREVEGKGLLFNQSGKVLKYAGSKYTLFSGEYLIHIFGNDFIRIGIDEKSLFEAYGELKFN